MSEVLVIPSALQTRAVAARAWLLIGLGVEGMSRHCGAVGTPQEGRLLLDSQATFHFPKGMRFQPPEFGDVSLSRRQLVATCTSRAKRRSVLERALSSASKPWLPARRRRTARGRKGRTARASPKAVTEPQHILVQDNVYVLPVLFSSF